MLSLKPKLEPTLAPDSVCKFILETGGLNVFGKPMYRMVIADTVGQLEGGEWHDYPEDAEINERGGLSSEMTEGGVIVLGEDPHKPERIVCEMRVVERYPDIEGWILERWLPPTLYGNKEQWESVKLKGHADVPILGPFPAEGGYDVCCVWQEEVAGEVLLVNPQLSNGVMISKSLREVPPLRVIERAIRQCEAAVEAKHALGATPEQRIRTRITEYVAREAARRAQRKAENHKRIQDHMKPYWGNSPESGRLREELAKRAHLTSHVGN